MIGTILDKYEILQKVGEGGMATVYRGRHTTLGRDVAIKILHPHLSASERNRQRFAREARAIEHLDHDNILKIFDYSGSVEDDCYIVTEFVDGATLQEMVTERGRLPSEVATIIGIHLATALAYAHGLGIIHRDLKPENVMLRRDGTVKLMDFGIARFLDEVNLTVTGALVGSPAYMSPEQAMERVLDPRSDLFSLGTLLFHLVTGQLPFSGSNPSIILRNIIEGNRPEITELTPDVSSDLAELIEALLQTDVGDRPNNAQAVEERLRADLAQVQLDPTLPAWGLQSWLADPVGYEARLDGHLRQVLLVAGRERLEQRDHLGALRLFNRLLSIDEDNEEVLELVQSMHLSAPRTTSRRSLWGWAGLAALLLTGMAVWTLWPPAPAPPPASSDLAEAQQEVAAPPPAAGAVVEAEDRVPEALAAIDPPATEPTVPGPGSTIRPPSQGVNALSAGARAIPARGSGTSKSAVRTTSAEATGGEAVEADPPGVVTVIVPGSWADIYIDDRHMGRTGEVAEIPVTPGTHTLRLENDLALPHTQNFTVATGEAQMIEVPALIRKPATVRLSQAIEDDCEVFLDGTSRGTVEALAHRIRISDPDTRHQLRLACPDGKDTVHDLPVLLAGSSLTVGEQ